MKNKELIQKASEFVNPKVMDNASMGTVACALITEEENVFVGVCIDTIAGMGFCAEHAAISQMITQGEYNIKRIVAVKKDANENVFILAPCGRCREFMCQINESNLETDIILSEDETVKLKELLPYHDLNNK